MVIPHRSRGEDHRSGGKGIHSRALLSGVLVIVPAQARVPRRTVLGRLFLPNSDRSETSTCPILSVRSTRNTAATASSISSPNTRALWSASCWRSFLARPSTASICTTRTRRPRRPTRVTMPPRIWCATARAPKGRPPSTSCRATGRPATRCSRGSRPSRRWRCAIPQRQSGAMTPSRATPRSIRPCATRP